MSTIKNHYPQADALTAETKSLLSEIQNTIIPDLKRRWTETVQTFSGQGEQAFSGTTHRFNGKLDNLHRNAIAMNHKVTEITGSGGRVQEVDNAIAKLYQS